MKTLGRMAVLWGLTVACAAGLQGGLVSGSADIPSVAEQVLGSARALVGNRMVIEADRYFHQGVGHTAERVTVSKVMMKWGDAISPKQHTVLAGGDLEEIMPWFRFATKIDPQNVEAYVTAAYWFVRNGHPDRAKKVLDEALEKNPNDQRILLALGHAFRHAGMPAAAEVAYRQALQAWSAGNGDDEREARVQMVEVLLSLGSLCEERGDAVQAISYYRALLDRFPEHAALHHRIAALQRGETLPASQFWNHSMAHAACTHEDHAHGACDHAHGASCDHDHRPEASPGPLLLSQQRHTCTAECTHER